VIAAMAMLGGLTWAQDLEQLPPPSVQKAQPMEIPASAPHVINYGFKVRPGWNLGMASDALGVYDNNPASLPQPSGDAAQRYSGNLSLAYLSQHTTYQADYIPSASYYRQFTSLNNTEQSLTQRVWHAVSARTSFDWHLDARQYPSWGGSSFPSSSFGSLLMQLSGLTGLDLKSNVSSANMGFMLHRKLNKHSSINAGVGGGVSKYVQINSNQIAGLLTAPDSSTWGGLMALSYDYQLSTRRSLGAGISGSYFLFTGANYHTIEQTASLHYSERFRNGWAYSIAAGPELREQQRSSGSIQPGLSLSFDVGRKTRRSSYRANVQRSYQIGQAQGNLTSWTASLSAERGVGRRGFAGVFASYLRSVSEVSVGQFGTGTTQSFAPAFTGGIRLGRHLIWFANYGLSAQDGVLTHQSNIHRQQFVSGFSFRTDSLFPH